MESRIFSYIVLESDGPLPLPAVDPGLVQVGIGFARNLFREVSPRWLRGVSCFFFSRSIYVRNRYELSMLKFRSYPLVSGSKNSLSFSLIRTYDGGLFI